ncbi:hypothetical protein IFM89_036859 [Coptis chinensis]|uniref:DUF8039 domain-containing protein n=1 Tax=Coptis chinensis TaxID=261450 RepID=A0A835HJQ7_9MAGN|nr:hypothetical protein IFM89_036859 [Coptis chinensis]
MADSDRAESSKRGGKRAKKDREAIYAAMTTNIPWGLQILDQQDDYQIPGIIDRRRRQAVGESFEEEVYNNLAGQSLEPVCDESVPLVYYSTPENESSDPTYNESLPNTDSSPERRSNNPTNDESFPNTHSTKKMLSSSTKGSSKKRRRGPAKCSDCRIEATESIDRLEVTFNERGQPINEESVKMVSLLGSLAREKVDITINDWRRVPKEKKDELWEAVKKEFIIEEKSRKYVMKELGYLWRTSKSRLNALIDSFDNEADRISAKPDKINPEQWKIFLRQRESEEYQEKRKKFKEMRAKQTITYTSSRKGYARLEAEMKNQSANPSSVSRTDVWEKAHTRKDGQPANAEVAEKMKKIQDLKASTPNSSSLKDDALSQVLGPERRSRVRGVGFGVTPSKLGLAPKSNEKVDQLEQEVKELKEKVSSMERLQQETQDQLKAMQILVNQLVQTQANKHMYFSDSVATPSKNLSNSAVSAQYGSNKPEGVKCKLFRMVKEDIVAEGRWVTDDPSTVVHDIPLGQGASKVWVDAAVEHTARLWRSTSDMERMKDAVGSVIAWPTDFIIKEEAIRLS